MSKQEVIGMSETPVIIERCRQFMDCEGWQRLERLARGLDAARKRPDLQIMATRVIAEYAFGKPAKQIELREIRKRQKFDFA